MKAILHSISPQTESDTVVGTVTLENNRAVLDEGAQRCLDGLVTMNSGDLSRPVTPEDGRRYIEALEYNWGRATFAWVDIVDDT